MTEEKVQVRRSRRMGGMWMLLITAFIFTIFRYSQEIISITTGTPIDQVADMGAEVVQRSLVAMFNLSFAVVFCGILAAFVENQLKPDAFGTLSRWGVLFSLFLLSYCLLVT